MKVVHKYFTGITILCIIAIYVFYKLDNRNTNVYLLKESKTKSGRNIVYLQNKTNNDVIILKDIKELESINKRYNIKIEVGK